MHDFRRQRPSYRDFVLSLPPRQALTHPMPSAFGLSNRRHVCSGFCKSRRKRRQHFRVSACVPLDSRVNLKEEDAMNLTIQLPDEEVPVLKAKGYRERCLRGAHMQKGCWSRIWPQR